MGTDRPLVEVHDLPGEAEPDPGSPVLRREKRDADLVNILGGDPGAVVPDLNEGSRLAVLIRDPRYHRAVASGDGLGGVQEEVDQHLLDKRRVSEELEVGRLEVRKENLGRFFRTLDKSLKKVRPRGFEFLIAGLNPHAGEDGLLGHEEIEEISPAIRKARREGMKISGPFPPDVVFRKALGQKNKVVIALYHDQGLIPFKLEAFDTGVNASLGLPFVRTSPDHGTAFDIAGKTPPRPPASSKRSGWPSLFLRLFIGRETNASLRVLIRSNIQPITNALG